MDTELRQQPASDKGAENADDDIANETKAGPAHDLTCQPACNQTDKQDEQQAFTGHVHWLSALCCCVVQKVARLPIGQPASSCVLTTPAGVQG